MTNYTNNNKANEAMAKIQELKKKASIETKNEYVLTKDGIRMRKDEYMDMIRAERAW